MNANDKIWTLYFVEVKIGRKWDSAMTSGFYEGADAVKTIRQLEDWDYSRNITRTYRIVKEYRTHDAAGKIVNCAAPRKRALAA